MNKQEREAVIKIKEVMDEGFNLAKMNHSDGAVMDAHQRINLLYDEAMKQELEAKANKKDGDNGD